MYHSTKVWSSNNSTSTQIDAVMRLFLVGGGPKTRKEKDYLLLCACVWILPWQKPSLVRSSVFRMQDEGDRGNLPVHE